MPLYNVKYLSILYSQLSLSWSYFSLLSHSSPLSIGAMAMGNAIVCTKIWCGGKTNLLLTLLCTLMHGTIFLSPHIRLQNSLKIAVFVKEWPQRSHAGGLECHASTLHWALAKRDHELHIFSTLLPNSTIPKYSNQKFVFSPFKTISWWLSWSSFCLEPISSQNSTGKSFWCSIYREC